MNLSHKQKMLLHVAAKQAGASEAQRRVVQQNVGGFYSAADRTVSREGFIAVMAFWEGRCEGKLDGFSDGYWTDQDAKASPTDALVFRITAEARKAGLAGEKLDAFASGPHMSQGRYKTVAEMPAYWLRKLLEALLQINRRASRPQGARRPEPRRGAARGTA